MRLPARQASTMIRNIASRSLLFLSFLFFLRAHITSSWYIASTNVNRTPFLWIPFYYSILGRRFAHPAVCFTALNAFKDFPNDRALLVPCSFNFFLPQLASLFLRAAKRKKKGKGEKKAEKGPLFDSNKRSSRKQSSTAIRIQLKFEMKLYIV